MNFLTFKWLDVILRILIFR